MIVSTSSGVSRSLPSGGIASPEDAAHHIPRHPGEPNIETLKLGRETVVIDPEKGEHGRVEIVNTNRIFNRPIPELVGRAPGCPRFDPAAGHEDHAPPDPEEERRWAGQP